MNTADTLLREGARELTTQPTNGEQHNSTQEPSLRDSVEKAVSNYFQHLDGQDVSDVYDMVLAEVEAPMLEVVMKYTRHNQTRAAHVLGLNRGTLRKKLKQYGLL
ncbi:DNA-binding transcriptional regulator Fis [Teredinibacter franksiae]|jgi:Factor for inversion stimulation Fis, transcriptional activator|uniref:DNA-binding transcriptional regulator Fis n=1 Tax=Teredinibacter franksiae TaxID=2761453 RepID=UPI0016284CB2|nr:DNA-binding transcriptional regulator Fis [Teredinibacter franksiae]